MSCVMPTTSTIFVRVCVCVDTCLKKTRGAVVYVKELLDIEEDAFGKQTTKGPTVKLCLHHSAVGLYAPVDHVLKRYASLHAMSVPIDPCLFNV